MEEMARDMRNEETMSAYNQSSSKVLDAIRTFLTEFNDRSVGEKINIDAGFERLQNKSAVMDEIILTLKVEDLAEIFQINELVARALHNRIKQASAPKKTSSLPAKLLQSETLLKRFHDIDLLKLLDPNGPRDANYSQACKVLEERIKPYDADTPVIVIDNDGNHLVEESLKCIENLRKYGQVPTHVTTSQGRFKLWPIRVQPNQVIELHPLTGAELSFDGRGEDGYQWGSQKLSVEVRKFLRAVSMLGAFKEISTMELAQVNEAAQADDAISRLSKFVDPNTLDYYDEAKRADCLPKVTRPYTDSNSEALRALADDNTFENFAGEFFSSVSFVQTL